MQHLFNSKVNIIRLTKVSDGLGGWDEVENILHSNLSCRINWSSGSERIQFDKTTYYRDAKLYCRVVDVTTKDRVRYDSKDYEIVNVSNPDNINKYLILEIKLID